MTLVSTDPAVKHWFPLVIHAHLLDPMQLVFGFPNLFFSSILEPFNVNMYQNGIFSQSDFFCENLHKYLSSLSLNTF